MKIEKFGYNNQIESLRKENNLEDFEIGRVIAEHKERYIVKTENGDIEAEITGNLRFSAESRVDYPAVGDWVALISYDSDSAIIHQIFPRISMLSRQAVGQFGEIQIIASNIDYAFLVQASDRDFNINRLERYLTICYSSKIEPIIILTKTDLRSKDEILEIKANIRNRVKDIPIIAISSETKSGYDELESIFVQGKTYCLLGSSGVGKSTLLNNLSGKEIMKTDAISLSTNKGRHITSHRELFILENGGILIDTQGMREVGITDSEGGLEATFDQIYKLSQHCKFADCTHTTEIGCAVLEALELGEIEEKTYDNYMKMEKEKAHFESTSSEKKKKDKELGKILKNYKKITKNRK